MTTLFIRTCQECGKRVKAKDPQGNPSNAYLFRACPACKSEAFDYGSNQDVDENLNYIMETEQ
jgi:hypothetical protein